MNVETGHIKPILLRISIGITGHRKLANFEEIKKSICHIVDRIDERYKDQKYTRIQYTVVSPLAEGADRLVPRTIMEYRSETSLRVVLPIIKSEYEKDFKTEKSKNEFNALLSQCRYPLSLQQKSLKNEYPENMQKKARSQAYKDAGVFVVDHCDILIAVWDKEPARGIGGTGNIVNYAKKTKRTLYIIDSNNPDLSKIDFYDGVDTISSRNKKIQLFNRELAEYDKKESYGKGKYNSFHRKKINSEKSLDDTIKKRTFNLFLPYYKVSSSITKRFQNLYRRVGLISFWLAFSAVAIVSGGVVFFHTPALVFLLEALILISILIMVTVADKKRSHRNWLENRFLTERIRSAVFFSLCQVKMAPFLISRENFDDDKNGIWVLTVLEEILSQVPEDTRGHKQPVENLKQYIREAWIDDQKDYHEDFIKKKNKTNKILEFCGIGIFYSAIVFALIHFFTHILSTDSSHSLGSDLLTFSAILLPALAASLEAIRGHRQYKILISRSKKMITQLNEIRNEFELLYPEKFEKLLQRIDKIMMQENEEWMSLMSYSKLHKVV